MRNGDFSRYCNLHSPIHLLNPLCKILALIIFTVMVVMGSSVKVMLSLFLVLIFVISISNVNYKYFFSILFNMKVLIICIFLLNILFGVSFYSGFIMICKVVLITLYSSALLFTTTTNELAFGFSLLFRPLSTFGVPITKISMAIALSINFIPSLFYSSNKVLKAQMSRGFNYKKGSFKDKIIGIKSVFIPVFISSIKRADDVADSMEVKNFNFDSERSSIKGFRWYFNDVYMIVCHLIVLVLVLVKEVVL